MTAETNSHRRSFDTQADVMDFCRSEYNRTRIADRDLFLHAANRVGLLVPDAKFSVPVVLDRIKRALQDGVGLSLLRVGNGEGNAVSMTKPELETPMIDTFFAEFNSQNYWPIELAKAISFSHKVKASLVDADIVGFRSFTGDEDSLIAMALDAGNAYAALGISYARAFLHECLDAGIFSNKIVTSAWIHLDLIRYIDELLALGERVIVITGRSELQSSFEQRLGSRLVKFIAVPVQGHVPERLEKSHYCDMYPKVVDALSENLSGCLVVVGAGLFGKIYCATAKRSGGVAVDLGSAFDVFSGLTTRPVFARYNFDGAAWVSSAAP